MPSSSLPSRAGLITSLPSVGEGETKRRFFQSVGEQSQAVPVVPQHLQELATAAAKHKQATAEWVFASFCRTSAVSLSDPLRISMRPTASHTPQRLPRRRRRAAAHRAGHQRLITTFSVVPCRQPGADSYCQ
jgi:hypothetical protein